MQTVWELKQNPPASAVELYRPTSIALVTSPPLSYPSTPAGELLIPPAKISNFTGREGNDVREAPHHSPR